MNSEFHQSNGFWEEAYEKLYLPHRPSQFAAFVANEVEDDVTIIDLGCGNGRDMFFFTSLGFKVIGVDASSSAIRNCNKLRKGSQNPEKSVLIRSEINDYLCELEKDSHPPLSFYCRFVYHCFDEFQSIKFLELLANCMRKSNNTAYLEFRSLADKDRTRVTPDHYRRFETLEMFKTKCNNQGLIISYAVEGRGFAKWKQDDAIVVRAVLRSHW